MADYDLGTARGTIELDASSLGQASAAFMTLGAAMVGMGAAGVVGFAYVVKSAAEFEKVMSAVQAVSNATADEMDQLRDVALRLGSSTVYSATEIATAFEDLAKAGLTVPEIINGAAEATINLAAAAGDELPGGVARGAEIIANAMKTFEASAEDMNHFADVLVGAAASSTVNVEDLATSLTYVGPVAHAAGLSFDELNTVLAILGDRGIRGSTAGTSLRGILLSLSPTSEKAANAMRELGIITEDGSNKFFDAAGNMKDMGEVMQILQDHTRDLSEEQKIQAFNSIFQRRAMAAALGLAEAGAEGFEQYAQAMLGLTAADIAATKIDNLSGDVEILKNSFDALVIAAGIPLQDMLRGFVQGLTDIVNKLQEIDPELMAQIVLYIGIAGAVLVAIGSFFIFVGVLLKMYKIWVELKAAILLVKGAVLLLSSSLLASPITWIVLAIAALVAGLIWAYHNVDWFRQIVDDLWESFQRGLDVVKEFAGNLIDGLKQLWKAFQVGGIEGEAFATALDGLGLNGEMIQGILIKARDIIIAVAEAAVTAFLWIKDTAIPAIVDFGTAVAEVAQSVWGWLNEHLFPVFVAFGELVVAIAGRAQQGFNFLSNVISTVFNFIVGVIQNAWAIIGPLVQWGVDFIIGAFTVFRDNIWPLITTTWNFIWGIIVAVFNFIKGTVESALQIIRGIINVVTGLISGDWGKVWEGIKTIFGGVWEQIQNIVTFVMDLMYNIITNGWELIKAIFQAALDFVILIVTSAWTFLQALTETVWNAIVMLIETTWNNIWAAVEFFINLVRTIIETTMNTITGIFEAAWGLVKWVFTDGINAVLSFMRALPGNILSAIGDVGQLLMEKGRAVINGLWLGITFIWNEVSSWFGGLPGMVLDFFAGAGTWLLEAGKNIIQGLIDGIKDMAGSVGDAMGGIVEGIGSFLPWSPAKAGFLKTHPPQKGGKNIIEMMAKGIADATPMLQAAMDQASAAAYINASGAVAGLPSGQGASVVFDFSNGQFGEGGADEVRKVITDPLNLSKLTQAIKAGSR